jgi:hypothetical protein
MSNDTNLHLLGMLPVIPNDTGSSRAPKLFPLLTWVGELR